MASRSKVPEYMVVETFEDGSRIRRTSGSYQVCVYTALEIRGAGFDADVFRFSEGLDDIGAGLMGRPKNGANEK
jgi:hypothetical protein